MIRSLLLFCSVIVVLIPSVQAADEFEATSCRSGTYKVIFKNEDVRISTFEVTGIVKNNTNSEILNNVSEMSTGVNYRNGEKTKMNGYAKYLYGNGDFNIMEWENDGSRSSGTWRFILGTGKWNGLKGGGTWQVGDRAKSIAEGTFQNCLIMKGTYELPK
jgi:hypothetical protein